MGINERENLLRFYNHEPTDHLPDVTRGLHLGFPVNGFHERPPHNGGGRDWFGVDWVYEESGDAPVPDPNRAPLLDSVEEWRDKVAFPDLETWDWKRAKELDGVDTIDRKNKVYDLMVTVGPFERLQALTGFEPALVAMVMQPVAVAEFFDAFTDYKCRLIEKLCEHYRPDVMNVHDDWGTQLSMFFSPEIWRRLMKPRMKRLADVCHEHGTFFEIHSCGRIEEVVPDFVEVGADCFQGMCLNDVSAMKEYTGAKLSYLIMPDYQRYDAASRAGTLSEKELRADVRDFVLRSARGGCFAPFATEVRALWYPPLADEVDRCRTLLRGDYGR